LLDEFPQLGKSVGEVAQTLMELGRSRGIRMIFMVQDLSQLEQVLGKDRGDVMRSLQQTRIWCKSSAEAAAKSSDLFGNKEVIRMIENVDANDKAKTSQTIVPKKVINEEAFTGLEILANGAEVILAIDDALVKTVVPFTDMPDIRPKVIESESWKNGLLDVEFDEHAGKQKQKDDKIRLQEEAKETSEAENFWKNLVV
jgi:type IV secretory pathway TraG/TraD family ATPase VirD4